MVSPRFFSSEDGSLRSSLALLRRKKWIVKFLLVFCFVGWWYLYGVRVVWCLRGQVDRRFNQFSTSLVPIPKFSCSDCCGAVPGFVGGISKRQIDVSVQRRNAAGFRISAVLHAQIVWLMRRSVAGAGRVCRQTARRRANRHR